MEYSTSPAGKKKKITLKAIGNQWYWTYEYPDNGGIEITANFIMEEGLPPGHLPSILTLIRDGLTHTLPKGSIYFSPLTFGQPSRARLFEFNRLKVLSRLPTFLYIIQRL